MGYHTHNIITIFENEEAFEEIKSSSKDFFRYHQIKIFQKPFEGIIIQINENEVQYDFLRGEVSEKYDTTLEQEVYDNIYSSLENIPKFSQRFLEKNFAYIEADCFGGTCMYEGYIMKNGEKVLAQESTYNGHITLLRFFEKNYNQGYFEPFTRGFFTKRAEIKGEVKDFTLPALWLLMKTDYGEKQEYNIYVNSQYVSFSKRDIFYFDFKKDKANINISGKLYDLSEDTIQKIKSIIEESFVGVFDYKFDIHMLDTDAIIGL